MGEVEKKKEKVRKKIKKEGKERRNKKKDVVEEQKQRENCNYEIENAKKIILAMHLAVCSRWLDK